MKLFFLYLALLAAACAVLLLVDDPSPVRLAAGVPFL